MTPSEIVTEEAKKYNADPNIVLNYIAKQIQSGKANLLQSGNSVLLLIHLGHGAAQVHLYTIDTPLALRRALANFIQTIKQTPIKRLYGKADNSQILQLASLSGWPIEHSDIPQFNWMAKL